MAIYRILSFDPGLSTLGWAGGDFNTDTNKLEVVRFGNFKATKTATKEKEQSSVYGQRLIALNLLEAEVIRLIDFLKPDYIASEDVFLQMRHVNAFTALTLCLHTMKKAAFMRNKVIYTMAPCNIKKATANDGHADKDAIQNSILHHDHITIQDNKQNPVNKMCEHEADAIAVGYSFAVTVLPTLLLDQQITIEDEIKNEKKKSKDKEKSKEKTSKKKVEYTKRKSKKK